MQTMKRTPFQTCLLIVMLTASMTATAVASKICDIADLQGTRINRLQGFGLVIGLNGTGDGEYVPTMRALAQMHERFGNPVVSVAELAEAKNVAIVHIEAVLSRDGVREGDRVDVHVSSIGGAKSLLGGRLLMTPLVGPNPNDGRVMALAGGPVLVEQADVLTVGRVPGGATLEQNWIHNYICLGRDLAIYRNRSTVRSVDWVKPDAPYVTFVIKKENAGWGVANTIARTINADAAVSPVGDSDVKTQMAVPFDPRTVIVRIPDEERNNPAGFLARLEGLELFMLPTEAKVRINRKVGNITMSADVEIAPAIISHGGLTIETLVPEQPATMNNPRLEVRNFHGIDPQHKGGAKLDDLLTALKQLQVPIEDRIAIVEQLDKTGRLYASLIVEE
jgi:flagellar P-ring protein precursor FlgI